MSRLDLILGPMRRFDIIWVHFILGPDSMFAVKYTLSSTFLLSAIYLPYC
jgi:hypothetical protein